MSLEKTWSTSRGQRAVLGLGADAGIGGNIIQGAGVLHPDIGVGGDGARGQGGLHRRHVVIGLLGGVLGILLIGQVVGAEHHVLGGHGDGAAVLGPQQVVGREHEHPGLGLGLGGQGHVDSHLVAVEVGVEGGTHQGCSLMARPSTSTGSKA